MSVGGQTLSLEHKSSLRKMSFPACTLVRGEPYNVMKWSESEGGALFIKKLCEVSHES